MKFKSIQELARLDLQQACSYQQFALIIIWLYRHFWTRQNGWPEQAQQLIQLWYYWCTQSFSWRPSRPILFDCCKGSCCDLFLSYTAIFRIINGSRKVEVLYKNTILLIQSINIIKKMSIYEESSSEAESILKSESTSQVKSSISKLSCTSHIIEMVKYQLLNYQDIRDDQFILLPCQISRSNPNQQPSDSQFSSYMNYHMTEVPIGPNFQAATPAIMTSRQYQKKRESMIKSIKLRKIHDPEIDSQFYNQYKDFVTDVFGSQKSYEDINAMRTAFEKKSMHQNFIEYLRDEQILDYWQDFFITKEKLANKINKRRKKKTR